MTEQQSLLGRILDDPDTDAPRLDYAAWLEESGRTPHAELIRVQSQLAKKSQNDPDFATLHSREQELRRTHSAELGLFGSDGSLLRGFLRLQTDVAGFIWCSDQGKLRSPWLLDVHIRE